MYVKSRLFFFSEANLFRDSLGIHFSAHVGGVAQVIALGSSVLGFSRPRVRDVTCPRKQVPIQARETRSFLPPVSLAFPSLFPALRGIKNLIAASRRRERPLYSRVIGCSKDGFVVPRPIHLAFSISETIWMVFTVTDDLVVIVKCELKKSSSKVSF